MFGYVKAFQPELKMKDYEVYRAMYCSLCKTLGSRYGLGARMFLNYDLSFMALALTALADDCTGFVPKRCDFNPSKKCNIAKEVSPALETAADSCILLTYYKIKDTISDSRGKKRAAAYSSLPYMKKLFKKAEKLNPHFADMAREYIESQAEVEKEKPASIDRAAHPSAFLLSQFFSHDEKDEAQKTVRERLGYCLGRWVYLIDACDDFYDDLKSGNYNPYTLIFSENTAKEDIHEKMKGDLNQTAAEAAAALDLIDTKRFHDILENVIYDGLFHESESVLNRRFANAEKPL